MGQCKIHIKYVTRFLALGVGAFVAATSVLTILTFSFFRISDFIMAFYYLLFAIVLILAEFEVGFILKNFKLLQSQLGRAIFCLIIGLIMLRSSGLQLACAITLAAFGGYHVIIYFCSCGKDEQKQKQITEKQSDLSARDAPLAK